MYTGQHKSMRDPVGSDSVRQSAYQCLLPDQLVEPTRPVFARKDAISGGIEAVVHNRLETLAVSFGFEAR